jgi:hypothetical protein
MYTTIRNLTGDTFMACKECGHALSMDKICEKPIQSATDMLKHLAVHNASLALGTPGPVGRVEPRSSQQACATISFSSLKARSAVSIVRRVTETRYDIGAGAGGCESSPRRRISPPKIEDEIGRRAWDILHMDRY